MSKRRASLISASSQSSSTFAVAPARSRMRAARGLRLTTVPSRFLAAMISWPKPRIAAVSRSARRLDLGHWLDDAFNVRLRLERRLRRVKLEPRRRYIQPATDARRHRKE